METKFNILVVDDHFIFRSGLVMLLSRIPNIQEIFQAENGIEALHVTNTKKVDIVIMDLEMPEMNGFLATKMIHNVHPEIKIIILSIHEDRASILEALANGANGYLFKNTSIKELKIAINSVMHGEHYFQKEIAGIMVKSFSENQHTNLPFKNEGTFSDTEREIIQLLCEGLTAKEIATKMALSKRRIEAIKNKLYLKTGTNNERSLIAVSFRSGMIR